MSAFFTEFKIAVFFFIKICTPFNDLFNSFNAFFNIDSVSDFFKITNASFNFPMILEQSSSVSFDL